MASLSSSLSSSFLHHHQFHHHRRHCQIHRHQLLPRLPRPVSNLPWLPCGPHLSSSELSYRRRKSMAALSSQTADIADDPMGTQTASIDTPFQVTYLEMNTWIWNIFGLRILIDPVLVGNLDFGVPLLYEASRRKLKEFKLQDLPELDLLLITQGYDDHCHVKTLEPLSRMFPDLEVISTPNAEDILSKFFKKVVYLEPGNSIQLTGKNKKEIKIRASPGPVLGPPWQRPENGYFVEVKEPCFTVYFEPHCVYDRSLLQNEKADVVITPVVKQVIVGGYDLVSGQQDAADLVRLLQAKIVVPLQNGNIDVKGILSSLVSGEGSVEGFKDLLRKDSLDVQVLVPKPGVPLTIPVDV